MGKSSRRKLKKRSRQRSPSSSSSSTSADSISSSDTRELRKTVKRLQSEVSILRYKPSTSVSVDASDALLIPVFDPKKNDVTIDMWIKRVEKVAERYS